MEINIKGYKVLIDEDDYERVSRHGWSYKDKGHPYFHASISDISSAHPTSLHRFIMGCVPGDGIYIDHINGNTLDNRKSNLRRCEAKGNCRNSAKPKNNTSGYKGVRKGKSGLYAAFIKVNYRQISLNMWDTPEDAAYAYDIAALYYFKEFARLNYPKEQYANIDIEQELRLLTRKLPRRNTSGVVGVYFRNDTHKWTAQIAFGKNKVKNLGAFDTIEEAAEARKQAERALNRINLHERQLQQGDQST